MQHCSERSSSIVHERIVSFPRMGCLSSWSASYIAPAYEGLKLQTDGGEGMLQKWLVSTRSFQNVTTDRQSRELYIYTRSGHLKP